MNLIYADIVDVSNEPEGKMARVRVGGAISKVTVELLSDVQSGDRVLICDNVAIAKSNPRFTTSEHYVSGNSR